jgi:hypothetical protein
MLFVLCDNKTCSGESSVPVSSLSKVQVSCKRGFPDITDIQCLLREQWHLAIPLLLAQNLPCHHLGDVSEVRVYFTSCGQRIYRRAVRCVYLVQRIGLTYGTVMGEEK